MTHVTIDQAMQAARQHHQAGQLAEAETIYRQVLAQQPNHVDALHLLGMLAGEVGRLDAAAELIAQAVQLQPDFAEAQVNLGNVLQRLWRFDDAIAAYRKAIAINPNYADAYNNLGVALKGLGRLDEAVAAYRQAMQFHPDSAETHNNIANALKGMGRLDEAVDSYRRAIALQPDYAGTHNNLGNACKDAGRIEEAIAAYRTAVQLRPGWPGAHDNLVFALNYDPAQDAATIHAELLRWNQQHAAPLARFIQPHTNDRDPDRPLRIGYVSPDFHEHACAFFLLPLLRCHDRRQFEVTCYAQVADADKVTRQMQQHVPQWRKTVGHTDAQVAEMIRQDKIDILVDLALHEAHNRLLVFAEKPAPVQVTWLGYPGTTGLGTIDYRLTDPHLDPPGIDESCYSEKSIRLPETFWCYDPLDEETPVNASPCAETGHITFGCLNNFCKINDAVLALWAKVLAAVPASRLLLHAPEGIARNRVLDHIDADRIEFVAKQPLAEYRRTYHRIDIALDPFPCGGGTTSCDALWMGVPVVTLRGRTTVGRAGVSILTNAGLPEMIAADPEQYVRITRDLAADRPRLADLRANLRQRLRNSPAMDAPRFARNIEAAYRLMWREWCAT
jgi:protein O-GlcNAc transferase